MANPPVKAAQGNKASAAPAAKPKSNINGAMAQVIERIRTSDNVLIALSKDPSIDELTAALGLTYVLDKIGKHATAIFSGEIPNIIEFLEPEKTFESDTNSLQDFIVAINKDKADHLRYKIDGDYVKVFITPYKTTISEADMEFSHGDYNVDLVIAFNVANEGELDGALTEYGRIMHDASSINISAHEPGKFGDLEWGDKNASSVSEMVARLANTIKVEDIQILDKTVSTTLLAGIMSATNRFSNDRTTAETMAISAKLMAAGADQQLISSNVPVEILTQPEIDAEAERKAAEEAALKVAAEEAARKKLEEEKAAAEEEARKKIEAEQATAEETKEEEAAAEPEAVAEAETETETESEAEPKTELEPTKPSDPTALTIHHGAVDYKPEAPEPTEPTEEEKAAEAKRAEKEAAIKAEAARIAAETKKANEEKAAAKKAAEEKARAEAAARKKLEEERAAAARKAIEEKVAAELAARQAAPAPAPVEVPAPQTPAPAPEVPAAPVAPEPPKPAVSAADATKLDDLDRALAAALGNTGEISPASVIIDKTPKNTTTIPSTTIIDAAAAVAPQASGSVNRIIAAPKPAEISNPLVDVASSAASANPAKTIDLPEGGIRPPEPPKDYSAAMEAALANETPAPSAPIMQPIQPAVPEPTPDMSGAEYVAPLPMPDPDMILPPPPLPFEPNAAPTMPEMPAAAPAAPIMSVPATPSAQQVVGQMQAEAAAVEPSMPAVQPIQPAELAPATTPGLVMQDQVYPDPGAFRIPGM